MKKILYFAVFLMVTSAFVTGVAYLGYDLTDDIILENRNQKITDNIALLYSPEDGYQKNDTQLDNAYNEKNRKYTDNPSGNISGVYEVLDSENNLVAIIYNVNAQGRNGIVNALISVDPYTDSVVGVTYYEHGETPNLGEKYTREDAIVKLLDQTITEVEVDLIVGATTTWGAINDMFHIIGIHYTDEEVHING
jgi:Na+-transporting NADH:ubiquinone oxidoreductase subunit C